MHGYVGVGVGFLLNIILADTVCRRGFYFTLWKDLAPCFLFSFLDYALLTAQVAVLRLTSTL